MFPFSIKLKSYRAFRDEASLNVRPLTLLYGQNQAGKSTLLRLLALLADSMQPNAGPLDLDSPSLRGAVFKELGWMGRGSISLTPEFNIVAETAEPSPRLRIQFADEKGLIVNRLDLTEGPKGDKFRVSLASNSRRSGKEFFATFAGKYKGADWSGDLLFDSYIPQNLPADAEKIAEKIKLLLKPLEKLQWLRANRLVDGTSTDRPVRCCKPDGSDLAAMLSGAYEKTILENAIEWFSKQEGLGNDIAISPGNSGRPQMVIGALGKERLPLHLAGEGIRSLLPILLTACWSESDDGNRPSMLAIEEPEAHLHPTLQVALFDRLLKTISAGVPVVLETHSVYILRAMQVAVLEGRIAAKDVGLHWVSQGNDGAATVDKITVEKDASLTGWRPFVFEKEQELAHRIVDLRWKLGGDL